MPNTLKKTIKICGITDKAALEAAEQNNADMVGFVFYPPSPRNISYQNAAKLINNIKKIKSVGLFVNPDDRVLQDALSHFDLDYIQLHGNETPKRIETVKKSVGKPIIKAFRIGEASDLDTIPAYNDLIDWIILDSKPKGAKLPGGTGHSFNWSLLNNVSFSKPWMLSGGLNKDNISDALSTLNPDGIDVSSGVEDAPGQKNPEKIMEFISAVRKIK